MNQRRIDREGLPEDTVDPLAIGETRCKKHCHSWKDISKSNGWKNRFDSAHLGHTVIRGVVFFERRFDIMEEVVNRCYKADSKLLIDDTKDRWSVDMVSLAKEVGSTNILTGDER